MPPPPPSPPSAPPAAPGLPSDQITVSRRYDPQTGGPLVSIEFLLRDSEQSRQYTFTVPMAELIAEQMQIVCLEHRTRFDDQWFEPKPEATGDG
jgi:hypothetical protein